MHLILKGNLNDFSEYKGHEMTGSIFKVAKEQIFITLIIIKR